MIVQITEKKMVKNELSIITLTKYRAAEVTQWLVQSILTWVTWACNLWDLRVVNSSSNSNGKVRKERMVKAALHYKNYILYVGRGNKPVIRKQHNIIRHPFVLHDITATTKIMNQQTTKYKNLQTAM